MQNITDNSHQLTSELPPLSTLDVEPLLESERGARTANCKAGERPAGLRAVVVAVCPENVLSTHCR